MAVLLMLILFMAALWFFLRETGMPASLSATTLSDWVDDLEPWAPLLLAMTVMPYYLNKHHSARIARWVGSDPSRRDR